MKDLFYGLMIIVIVIGGMVFAADKYAKYETRQKVMEHFDDEHGLRNDIDYSMEKIGPLVYKCTGTEEGLFGEQYSYIAGFDTEGLLSY